MGCDSPAAVHTVEAVSDNGPEEPRAVFAQPELPFEDLEALDAVRRIEQWLASQPVEAENEVPVIAARLFLVDNASRMQRADRWREVSEINARCSHDWGVLMHGGPETVFLLDEAANALIEGLWLASLLCSHAACERHLAGLLSMDEDSLPPDWRRWGLGRLLVEATDRDALPSQLVSPLETLNEVRKVSAHFKPPLHEGSLLNRAHAVGTGDWLRTAEEISKSDAFSAYETARSLVHRTTWA